jgi:NAD(P)-dependent dehydrogenase (short-subunit alcohol dehydrogenase family)
MKMNTPARGEARRRRTLGQKTRRAATLGVLGAGAYCLARRAVRGVADLRGQVVLIAGGSRGLGLAMARQFAAAGCKIALCARDAEELQRAHDELKSGGEVFTFPCDITKPDEAEKLVAAVSARYGRIDILVNNAGVLQVGPLASMTRDDYEAALNVMFWGAFHVTQAVLPAMRARRSGRIVNIISIAGLVPMPHLAPYNCAKSAALGFSRSLHIEAAKDGITVTTVLPGLMRTGSIFGVTARGHSKAEWTIFAVTGSLPGLTLRAEDAARRVVQAVGRSESELVLGAQYALLARVQGLFPGAVADVLSLLNRLLPGAAAGPPQKGREAREEIASPLLDALLRPNLEAAERLNQKDADGR